MTNYRHSKHLNFFGDSWYWNWYGPGLYDYELKSKTMKVESFYGQFESKRVGSIKLYLNEVGYESKVFNHPGYNFYQTTQSILKTEPKSNTIANIVFFSNLIRINNYKEFPINDYDATYNKIKTDTINLLTQIIDWAEKNKTYILLIGGQSTLSLEFFKAAPHSEYVILLSECILADLATASSSTVLKPFGMFKLACFTTYIDKNWDKKFVDVIYKDTRQIMNNPYVKLLMFPDSGHLNSLSSLFVLDMIFDKIEKLQINK